MLRRGKNSDVVTAAYNNFTSQIFQFVLAKMCSTSSTAKTKLVRSSNFSTKEQHVLISLIAKYKNIIECKESDTNSNRKKMQRGKLYVLNLTA